MQFVRPADTNRPPWAAYGGGTYRGTVSGEPDGWRPDWRVQTTHEAHRNLDDVVLPCGVPRPGRASACSPHAGPALHAPLPGSDALRAFAADAAHRAGTCLDGQQLPAVPWNPRAAAPERRQVEEAITIRAVDFSGTPDRGATATVPLAHRYRELGPSPTDAYHQLVHRTFPVLSFLPQARIRLPPL
ncbi:hypothetical protein GCM10009787_56860 [Streptomyces bangladeshensis]|uniref:DUF2169 domain-containing protein n=1 Tax=Streptomyces bangladeshensis TaxID=295352 RepID=A0ABN3BXK8_9ACTN